MNKCERENKSNIECSNPERDPEMFEVTSAKNPNRSVMMCLVHAELAEACGHSVRLILT